MSTGWSTGVPVLSPPGSAPDPRADLQLWLDLRSYSNDAAPDRSILRTIFPKTFSSRQIALIGLP